MIGLLEKHFGSLVDYDFTAGMEEDLDRIANGEQNRVDWLRGFYFGEQGDGGRRWPAATATRGCTSWCHGFGDIDAREVNSIPIGNDIMLRVGRYGPYVQRGPDGEESSQRATVPDDMAPDELTVEKAEELLAAPSGDRELGTHPETGLPVVAKAGRYGPYVTEVLPDDAPKNGEAAHRVAAVDDVAGHRDPRRRAAAAVACRAWSAPTRRTATRSPRRTAATGRT